MVALPEFDTCPVMGIQMERISDFTRPPVIRTHPLLAALPGTVFPGDVLHPIHL